MGVLLLLVLLLVLQRWVLLLALLPWVLQKGRQRLCLCCCICDEFLCLLAALQW